MSKPLYDRGNAGIHARLKEREILAGMSGLGFIRLFLFLWWVAALFASIFLFLFRKRRSAAIAGFMVAFGFIGFVLMGSTKVGTTEEAFVQKASEKIGECRALGDRPIIRSEKILVWDLGTGHVHTAQALAESWLDFFQDLDPRPLDVPVTVFLVSPKESRLVGTYSISRQPAYRERFSVYVVQFRNVNDSGTAVAMHEFWSFDPASKRAMTNSPGYGSFEGPRDEDGRRVLVAPTTQDSAQFPASSQPIEDWIRSLPTQ